MPQYTFYFLGNDGHIVRAETHVFGDDLSALKAAEDLSDDCAIEVWQLDRMVLRVKKGNAPLTASDEIHL